jgi:hypothetical protein
LRVQVAQDPDVRLGTDLCLQALSDSRAPSTSSSCLTADGVRPEARLSFLKDLMISSDPDHIATREVLGLRTVGPAEVTLVTQQEDCRRAVAALNTIRQEPGKIREVWVYRLGEEGYALDDPGLDVGYADKVLSFFGPDFRYKGTQSGF